MRKSILSLLLLLLATATLQAQRFMDKLDRGLLVGVADNGAGNFVSWRVLGSEYYDVTYNLYADGQLVAKNLWVSSYTHAGGKADTKYQVAPVVNGVEGAKCAEQVRWPESGEYWGHNFSFMKIKGAPAKGRGGEDLKFEFNDCVIADVNGDGRMEIIAKRCIWDHDIFAWENLTCFNRIECYTLESELLWYIDMGPNMCSGPDGQWDCVGHGRQGRDHAARL